MTQQLTNGNVSFWYADIGGTPVPRPSLTKDTHADVCIIGAGFTGLWTAYYLKKQSPKLNIVILEKEFAGFGASGRNGGWLSGEFGWSREKYAANSSRDAVRAFEQSIKEAVDEVIAICELEGIDADIVRTSHLDVACSAAQLARIKLEQAEAIAWGAPKERFELIDAEQTKKRINIDQARGALLVHDVARVQPAKLVQGLAKVVEKLGVTIYEKTTVHEIQAKHATTDHGIVYADYMVRATEGFTAGLKGYERLWIPLNSAIVVTEPIPEERWADIGWTGYELLGDASHAYCYAQRTRENRIAMGGRGVPYRFGSKTDHHGTTQETTIRQLQGILHRLLPQTKDIKLAHAWCGVLGVPRDWCTTVGLDKRTNIAWAGGYVGLGVTTSNLAGRTLCDLILDKDTDLTRHPWVNRPISVWEPEPLRWLGVHGMYQLYHMADRLEARRTTEASSILASFANRLTGR